MAQIIGGIIQAHAANKAGSEIVSATNRAADLTHQQYLTTRGDLQPYNVTGQAALPALTDYTSGGSVGGAPNWSAMAGDVLAGSPVGGQPNYLAMAGANLPGTMTQAQLEATPGYQFTRDQGLKAVQNSAAARGLGASGPAMKGAAQFATGLADSTYKDQFNIQQQRFNDMYNLGTNQFQNAFNLGGQQFGQLQNVASLGENAAAGLGQIGQQAAGQGAQAITTGGIGQAQGTMAAGNAIAGGINNFMNSANQNLLAMMQGGGTSGFG